MAGERSRKPWQRSQRWAFDSSTLRARLAQLVEAAGPNPACCGFESCGGHRNGADQWQRVI